MIITGPVNPATIPPNLKSFCSNFPVLNAIAFGGVEIGKNSAAEALKPITNGNTTAFEDTSIIATGINIVAVAVLLIKLDKTTVNNEKTTTNA